MVYIVLSNRIRRGLNIYFTLVAKVPRFTPREIPSVLIKLRVQRSKMVRFLFICLRVQFSANRLFSLYTCIVLLPFQEEKKIRRRERTRKRRIKDKRRKRRVEKRRLEENSQRSLLLFSSLLLLFFASSLLFPSSLPIFFFVDN